MASEDQAVLMTREWLRKADEDLRSIERVLEDPPLYDVAAFHAQQAIEKTLKGYLFWHGRTFRKTHNLVELINQCQEIDAEFRSFISQGRRISAYAIQVRYPDIEAESDPEAVKGFVETANEAFFFVQSRLPDSVRP